MVRKLLGERTAREEEEEEEATTRSPESVFLLPSFLFSTAPSSGQASTLSSPCDGKYIIRPCSVHPLLRGGAK